MKLKCLLCVVIFGSLTASAQVKFGDNPTTINSNSILELESSNKGFVLPRVSLTSTTSPAPLATGLLTGTMVYNTNANITGADGVGAGFYYWNGTQWTFMKDATSVKFQGTALPATLVANTDGNGGAMTDINYGSEAIDTHNAYNSGVFTAPRTGYYYVSANVAITKSTNWSANYNELYLAVFKTGTGYVLDNVRGFSATSTATTESPSLVVTGIVQLNTGQTIKIQAWSVNNGVARTIVNGRSHLSIFEL